MPTSAPADGIGWLIDSCKDSLGLGHLGESMALHQKEALPAEELVCVEIQTTALFDS